MTELRPVTCEFCGGDGWFCDERPTPTPQGPHYGPDVRCTACNGGGEYEVEFVPITEDDVWVIDKAKCSMGVGCYEAGVCHAAALGEPDRCPLATGAE